eukprot:gene15918-biopygen20225
MSVQCGPRVHSCDDRTPTTRIDRSPEKVLRRELGVDEWSVDIFSNFGPTHCSPWARKVMYIVCCSHTRTVAAKQGDHDLGQTCGPHSLAPHAPRGGPIVVLGISGLTIPGSPPSSSPLTSDSLFAAR